MLDAQTLREELEAIRLRLERQPGNQDLVHLYTRYFRMLRERENNDNGYVSRSITGY